MGTPGPAPASDIPKDLEVFVAKVRTGCMSLFQQESLGMSWVSLAPWAGLGDRASPSLRAVPAQHRVLGHSNHKPAFSCWLVAQRPVSAAASAFVRRLALKSPPSAPPARPQQADVPDRSALSAHGCPWDLQALQHQEEHLYLYPAGRWHCMGSFPAVIRSGTGQEVSPLAEHSSCSQGWPNTL